MHSRDIGQAKSACRDSDCASDLHQQSIAPSRSTYGTSDSWKPANEEHLSGVIFSVQNLHLWACGAVGSALPWHGRGRRFEPVQVHQYFNHLRDISMEAEGPDGSEGSD